MANPLGVNGWHPNPSSVGRPSKGELAYKAKMQTLLQDCVTEEDFVKVVNKAVTQAIDGIAEARSWLSKYLLPSEPNTTVDLSNHDNRVAIIWGPAWSPPQLPDDTEDEQNGPLLPAPSPRS